MRPAANRLGLQRTAVFQRRKIFRAVQNRPAGLHPVAEEARLELGYNRPHYLVVIVAPMLRGIGISGPEIGDARAANERNRAVNDQQFAMAAIVVTPWVRPEDAVIFDALHPGSIQL